MINGPDYVADEIFANVLSNVLSEYPDKSELKNFPFETLLKIVEHSDKTYFISDEDCELRLNDIVGPYTLFDSNRVFLCKVNLHSAVFGESLPEKDYIRQLRSSDILYCSYINSNGVIRDLQIMKL